MNQFTPHKFSGEPMALMESTLDDRGIDLYFITQKHR